MSVADDMPSHAMPVAVHQRIELLDGLRGFALAGVLLVNLTAFSFLMLLPHDQLVAQGWPLANRVLQPAIAVFANGRFMSLFSIMFGIGFALQLQRMGDDPAMHRRYARRLAILFAIGLAHAYLLWWGDILRYYALIGLLLLAVRRLPARWLAIGGFLLAACPHAIATAYGDWPATMVAPRDVAYASAHAAFAQPGWTTWLRGNAVFAHWWHIAHWSQVLWVAGCMLIGLAIGKLDLLRRPDARAWSRLLRWALPIGLGLSILLEVAEYRAWEWLLRLQAAPATDALVRIGNDVAMLTLALGYLAAFVWFGSRARGARLVAWLAPVGRLALSNYLAQSLLCVALFYGVGFGIGPRGGFAGLLLAWCLVFGLQIAWSHWWLARHRFGPAEWLWRSLTYGARQPMRLPAPQPVSRATRAR